MSGVMPLDQTPGSLAAAVRTELREAVRPPYTVPLVVAFNGLLMAAAWLLLPTKWFDWLFTLHGPLAFAMVMAGWMYSDVPATNVLAPDRERILAALDDPVMLSRLLFAQNLTLWCFVAPFYTVVAVIIGYFNRDWPPTLVSITAIAIVPFGALGRSRVGRHSLALSPSRPALPMAASPRVAPHDRAMDHPAPRPLRTRPPAGSADHHSQPRPLVDAVGQRGSATGFLPPTSPAASHSQPSVSMSVFYGGHRAGLRLIRRRHDQLRDYLGDPDRG